MLKNDRRQYLMTRRECFEIQKKNLVNPFRQSRAWRQEWSGVFKERFGTFGKFTDR